jgi:hypothetical protein
VNLQMTTHISAARADPVAVARIERVLAKDRAESDAKVVKVMRGGENRPVQSQLSGSMHGNVCKD